MKNLLRQPTGMRIKDHFTYLTGRCLTDCKPSLNYNILFFLIRIPALNKTDYRPCDVEIAKKAREYYFNGTITAEDLKQFINLNTDVQFW